MCFVDGPEDREYFGRDSVGSISEDVRNSFAEGRSGHSVQSLTTLNTAGGTRFSQFSPEMTSNLGKLHLINERLYFDSAIRYHCLVCS